jgi:hypothetical protein
MLGDSNLLLIPDVKALAAQGYGVDLACGLLTVRVIADMRNEARFGSGGEWDFDCSCVCKSLHYSTLLRSSLMRSRNLPFPVNAPNLLFHALEALCRQGRSTPRDPLPMPRLIDLGEFALREARKALF